MSSVNEDIECVDCGNDDGGVDCDGCQKFTCVDCCQVLQNGRDEPLYLCRQCYVTMN